MRLYVVSFYRYLYFNVGFPIHAVMPKLCGSLDPSTEKCKKVMWVSVTTVVYGSLRQFYWTMRKSCTSQSSYSCRTLNSLYQILPKSHSRSQSYQYYGFHNSSYWTIPMSSGFRCTKAIWGLVQQVVWVSNIPKSKRPVTAPSFCWITLKSSHRSQF